MPLKGHINADIPSGLISIPNRKGQQSPETLEIRKTDEDSHITRDKQQHPQHLCLSIQMC